MQIHFPFDMARPKTKLLTIRTLSMVKQVKPWKLIPYFYVILPMSLHIHTYIDSYTYISE